MRPQAAGGRLPTLRFALQGAKDLAWNIKLLWGEGKRVFEWVTAKYPCAAGKLTGAV